MVLRILGVPTLPDQSTLYALGGQMPFSINALAMVMNEISATHVPGRWQAQTVFAPTGNWDHVFQVLGASSAWIAHFRVPLERLGHLVVVLSANAKRIEVLDPTHPGTYYWMNVDEFMAVWNWEAVYLQNTPRQR